MLGAFYAALWAKGSGMLGHYVAVLIKAGRVIKIMAQEAGTAYPLHTQEPRDRCYTTKQETCHEKANGACDDGHADRCGLG